MMSTTAVPEHVLSPDPSEQDELVELREQLARIAGRRRRPVAKLVSPDGIEVEIPASAFAALQAVVRDMAQGHDHADPPRQGADHEGGGRHPERLPAVPGQRRFGVSASSRRCAETSVELPVLSI